MTQRCRFHLWLAMAGIILLILYGCWIPQNFKADVQVNADGSYIFKFDGELVFLRALSELRAGPLCRKDEENIKQILDQMKQQPGYKSVTYLGNGRCKVVVEKGMKSGEPYVFMSHDSKLFTIQPQKDGTLMLTAVQLSPEELNSLKTIDADTSGMLSVSLARGVKVLEHNGQHITKKSGSFDKYTWKINTLDPGTMILVKPAV